MKLRSGHSFFFVRLVCALLVSQIAGWTDVWAQQRPRLRPLRRDYLAGKFLLIPPDSRPVSIQTPRLIARLADHDVVLPPIELLGDVAHAGNPDRLVEWAQSAEYTDVEGVIVSLEMLGRGGSRGAAVDELTLRRRLGVIDSMRARRQGLPIYGLVSETQQTASLAIEMVATGKLDFLLFCRGEVSASEGESVERSSLPDQIAKRGLSSRVTITTGMDAAPQLLVARLLNHRFGIAPKVWIGTSRSPQAAGLAPLLLSQISAMDGRALPGTPDAASRSDVVFLVNAPETEDEGRAALLETAATAVAKGFRVALVDLVESLDSRLAMVTEIRRRKMFDQMIAYSGAVPGEAACASVLAQATSRLITMKFLRDDVDRLQRAERAQVELMLTRVVTETLYESVIRPKLEAFLRDQLKADPRRLGPARERAEIFAREETSRIVEEVFREQFFLNTHSILLATGERAVFELRAVQRMVLRFGWGTADEVELRAGVLLPLMGIVPPEGSSRASWELFDRGPLDSRLVRRFEIVSWPRFKTDVEQVSVQINLSRRDIAPEAYSIQSRRRSKVTRRIEILSSSAAGAFNALSRLEQLGIDGRLGEDFVLTEKPALAERGVMEGADGIPWSHRDRLDVIRFLGRVKMNRYYFAPKGESLVVDKWREPFSERELDRFKELVVAGEENFVSLVCGLRVGRSISYASEDDARQLTAKINTLRRVGVRHFLLAFDDSPETLQKSEDRQRFKSVAAAQAHLVNRVFGQLLKDGEGLDLSLIPGAFASGENKDVYLRELDAALVPEIAVVWPVIEQDAPQMAGAKTRLWREFSRRRVILLDSFPANEGMDWRPFLGPKIASPSDSNGEAVGLVASSMSQAHATMLPLATVADYAWDRQQYDAAHSLDRALKLMFDERTAGGMRTWSDVYRESRVNRHLFEPLFRRQDGEIDVPEIERCLSRLEDALESLGIERESGLTRAELSYFVRRTRIALRRLTNDPAYERLPDARYRLRSN